MLDDIDVAEVQRIEAAGIEDGRHGGITLAVHAALVSSSAQHGGGNPALSALEQRHGRVYGNPADGIGQVDLSNLEACGERGAEPADRGVSGLCRNTCA